MSRHERPAHGWARASVLRRCRRPGQTRREAGTQSQGSPERDRPAADRIADLRLKESRHHEDEPGVLQGPGFPHPACPLRAVERGPGRTGWASLELIRRTPRWHRGDETVGTTGGLAVLWGPCKALRLPAVHVR